jgi:micrococcal nuclease
MKMSKSWVVIRFLLLLLMVGVACLSALAATEEVEAKVLAVVDGNTLQVKSADGEVYTIMLHGVDCPELEQEFGIEARVFLEKLVLKKNVKVVFEGKDRWGNRLAVVWLKGVVDLRVELLKAGLAWTAERNPLAELENVRKESQERGKGIWASDQPTPPWIFRRQQTLLQAKSS